MEQIIKLNDYVRYAPYGICKIQDIAVKDFSGCGKREYYILVPASDTESTIYVPTENKALTSKMSRVISKSELDELILSSEDSDIHWVQDKKERGEYFHTILSKYNSRELLKLVRILYLKKCELQNNGKKLSSTDESTLRQAEKVVDKEFSFILEIPEQRVGAYIRDLLGISEKEE